MRVSAEQIRKIDETAIRDYGIPSLLLMENAGRSVSEALSRKYAPCRVLVIAGKGNNGGDGFVAARHLANRGYAVQVILLSDPSDFRSDPLLNFSILSKMNVPWERIDPASDEDISVYCGRAEVVVDAIFGVGIRGPVSGIFEKAILAINESQRPVISIDIPSGLDADSGKVLGVAVKAAITVTMSLPKAGLFAGAGPRYSGEIEIAEIGIPRKLLLPFLDQDFFRQ